MARPGLPDGWKGFLVWSLVFSWMNPVCRSFSFFVLVLSSAMISPRLAVYLPPLAMVGGYLGFGVLKYLLTVRLVPKISFRRFVEADTWSQLVYLPFLVFSWMVFNYEPSSFEGYTGTVVSMMLSLFALGAVLTVLSQVVYAGMILKRNMRDKS